DSRVQLSSSRASRSSCSKKFRSDLNRKIGKVGKDGMFEQEEREGREGTKALVSLFGRSCSTQSFPCFPTFLFKPIGILEQEDREGREGRMFCTGKNAQKGKLLRFLRALLFKKFPPVHPRLATNSTRLGNTGTPGGARAAQLAA